MLFSILAVLVYIPTNSSCRYFYPDMPFCSLWGYPSLDHNCLLAGFWNLPSGLLVHPIMCLLNLDPLLFLLIKKCQCLGDVFLYVQNGNALQCSCLENPRDGGAWWAAVYGVAQSQTRLKRLSSSSSYPFLKKYLFFIWLCWISVAICGI